MRPFAVLVIALSACFSSAHSAPVSSSGQYRDEPLVWEHIDTAIHMHADGTGDRTVRVTARLQSEGAVRQFTVVSVPFVSTYETGNIEYVRVHKPDGSTVETPVANAIELSASPTEIVPLYSDLKQKQLPVRSLSVGDVIEFQVHTTRIKAEAPGQFWGAEYFFTNAGVVLSQTLTLEVPANKYVKIWNPNHPTTPEPRNGLITYTWNTSQLTPSGKTKDSLSQEKIHDPDEDAEGHRTPSVAWTTFHSWAEVGDWYRGLAFSRSEPTPFIATRAKELTRDAKTPEEQLRALYDFVSKRIHYVGIDLGAGRFQPHLAEDVMNYQYGDCKDKDTLLESLLRAKGFTTAPALIGVNITMLPDLPSPALFNHVITTVDLPAGRIWLDTTPEVAPYRLLVPSIRDEQALVIPAGGAARLERTPADPPFPYFERFEAVASLDKDGLLKSHMEMLVRSDNELAFRILLERAAPAQWDEVGQSVSRAMGFQGTVSNTDLKQKDPAAPVQLSYDYTRPSFADWDRRRILPLFPALEITSIEDKAPDHDIDQGSPRMLQAVTRIRLPEGYGADLPDAIHVKRDYATFDQTYEIDKGELVVRRTAVILRKKVSKADWKDYYAYTRSIGMESGETYISLLVVPVGVPTVPAHETALTTIMNQARDLELNDQWVAAREKLNEVRAQDPNTPNVMSMLGFLANHEGKPEEAIHDYEVELLNHPNSSNAVVTQLASLYMAEKRYGEVESLLHKYVDRNDSYISSLLVNAQIRSGNDAKAIATLHELLAKNPNEGSLQGMLAGALHREHRDKEAIAIATTFLKSEDAATINSGAYLLSEMNLELPLAEAGSRRAIQILENASAQLTIENLDAMTIFRSDVLAFAWHTLGWILFQAGKPAEAEPYLHAGWFNRPDKAVGNQLAQVLEALHRPSEALAMNQMALLSDDLTNNTDNTAEIQRSIERLRQTGAITSIDDARKALQNMHTFQIARPAGISGTGNFRVAIAGDRIAENSLENGPAEMLTLSPELNQLKIPGALPPGSRARLLRYGVLQCASAATTCEFRLWPPIDVPVAAAR